MTVWQRLLIRGIHLRSTIEVCTMDTADNPGIITHETTHRRPCEGTAWTPDLRVSTRWSVS